MRHAGPSRLTRFAWSPDVQSRQIPIVRPRSQQHLDELSRSPTPILLQGVPELCWSTMPIDLEDVIARAGDAEVEFRQSTTRLHPDLRTHLPWELRRAPLRKVLHDILSGETNGGTMFMAGQILIQKGGKITAGFEQVVSDRLIPAFIPRDRFVRSNFWVSRGRLRSWLHHDYVPGPNLNLQLRGGKQVMLFAPEELARMYPYPVDNLDRFNFSQVDVEAPDLDRFSRFAEALMWVGELREGDALLLPAYWFHSLAHSDGVNVNLNFWWRSGERLDAVTAMRLRTGQMQYLNEEKPPEKSDLLRRLDEILLQEV